MAFVSGPRQCGKTTLAKNLCTHYLDWDNLNHQDILLKGPVAMASWIGLDQLSETQPVLALDEIHKFSKWKELLKGFFDTYEERCKIIVTGSSRLDIFKRGGDSLMGRYFIYRMHPFALSELGNSGLTDSLIKPPEQLDESIWENLWHYGGFPEPYLKADKRFHNRWQRLRREQLFKEDIRELTRVQELGLIEKLGLMLADRSGEQIQFAGLSKEIRMNAKTVQNWVDTLSSLHYGFLLKPWYKNLGRALRKEPKFYLRDWSSILDEGKRFETLVACHLLKAVQGWTDLGYGDFDLRYFRDKEKREVDFIVTRDGEAWLAIEAKLSSKSLSPNLEYIQKLTHCEHAFQVVAKMDYVNRDCFEIKGTPVVVPAKTFLSQLMV